MAFRASPTVKEAYEEILREFRRAKATAQARGAEIAAGPVEARVLINTMNAMVGYSEAIAAAVNTPGLAQYARDQHNDPNYDVVAEANYARGNIDSIPAWLLANLPTNANGRPDLHVWQGQRLGWRTFSTTETETLVMLLITLEVSITD